MGNTPNIDSMTSKRFNDLLKGKQPARREDDFIQNEINEWRDYLRQLYDFAASALATHVESEEVTISYGKKILSEQALGSYEVPTMKIQFAGHEVMLDPIGTMFIGSKGRVEMSGSNSMVALMLIRKRTKQEIATDTSGDESKVEWIWTIWKEPLSKAPVLLSKDAFLDALAEVSGG